MQRSTCLQDLDQLWPYIKLRPSQCASVQPCFDNEQSVQLPLSLHHSLLFKLILTTRQHLHAVSMPKCTYTHTHTRTFIPLKWDTHTHPEGRLHTYVCANTRAFICHRYLYQVHFVQTKQSRVISHLCPALQALFRLPPPLLLLTVLFKSVHLPVVSESAS